MTRRTLLGILPGFAFAQSRLPYGVRFVDIAAQAGLTHDVIYGGVDSVKYIVEANGCGVAFYD